MHSDIPRAEGPSLKQPLVTRRAALAVFAGLGLSALTAPRLALADVEEAEAKVKQTEEELAEAQRKYDETQARLEELADEFEQLSRAHDETLKKVEETNRRIAEKQAQIDAKQAEVDTKQAEVDAKQAELEDKQEILSKRIASVYKTGNAGVLELLLTASSFEEFISNVYYLGKISEADAQMIEDVRTIREELEAERDELARQKEELEAEKAELEQVKAGYEELRAQQEAELQEMSAKQDEVAELLANLDDDVKELMERRDAELMAAAEERAKLERARVAAASALIDVGGGQDYQSSEAAQRAVVNACYATPSPGYGLCAMWVSQVFDNAGFTYYGGNACDMYSRWCSSSNKDELQVGMIIAVSSHPHTTLGRIYGHVGIYVGDGIVMDNIGRVRTVDCDEWINYYGGTVTPRWGWCGDVALT